MYKYPKPELQSFFLVMEYCQLGNLFSYQYGLPDKVIKVQQSLKIFMQILKGLKCIQSENIIHRDLKCENILLKKLNKQGQYLCKIGDFGFAKQLSENAKSQCGTPNFMAPQILAEKSYDNRVDIWSIGIILFYMIFGDYPFKGLNILYDIEVKCFENYDLLNQINPELIKKKNKSLTDKDLQNLAAFFRQIFKIDPDKRITLSEMQRHPIFIKYKLIQNPQSIQQPLFDSFEEAKNNALKKVQFIEGLETNIKREKILNQQNEKLLQFYITKVKLWILSGLLKSLQKSLVECTSSKENIKKRAESMEKQLKTIKGEIQKLQNSKKSFGQTITPEVLSLSFQKFESFKDPYRVFLGYIFSEVHSKQIKEKQRLKIRILCCHTINRVFQEPISPYFACFNKWNNNKINRNGNFDFGGFSRWIEQDKYENIYKTISAINECFYSKK